MWPGRRPTSVPSFILIHATVSPQYTNVTDRQTNRQRSDSIQRTVFTASRNTRIASAVIAIVIPSVCPSVHLSVTRRYCVKRTAHVTVQFAMLDSKMCLILYKPKIFPRDDPNPLKSSFNLTYPLLIAASLDTFCLVAPQR